LSVPRAKMSSRLAFLVVDGLNLRKSVARGILRNASLTEQ
jgi:hypothetical protein